MKLFHEITFYTMLANSISNLHRLSITRPSWKCCSKFAKRKQIIFTYSFWSIYHPICSRMVSMLFKCLLTLSDARNPSRLASLGLAFFKRNSISHKSILETCRARQDHLKWLMHLLSARAMISRYNEVRFFSTTFDTFRYTLVIKYSPRTGWTRLEKYHAIYYII